ncbi:protein-tyrosine phosphatase family protein [Desulfobacterales bacterium HSG2]|nr:protein-tyrosine phosphatase family protein [Desulfobacterales bacterium HSG2]
MKTKIYWIRNIDSGHLGIMPRPRGGEWLEDEVDSLLMSGVNILVSLLELPEIEELGLADEANYCEQKGMTYLSFPIPDRGVPHSSREAATLVKKLLTFLSEESKIVIHCRQGIGRSALIAASVLVMKCLNTDTAFERIAEARNCEVPDTGEQVCWVREFHSFIKLL